ncbi:histone-lysine N-methyltransferase ASHR3 isoform X2 [Typha angustifolia]|uniref:histone-lysine N-methyltransferase ASHR3 isoform X2 n=1 Tax=Typha angustifolia TaxID=59011 RepID=UPI003C2FB2BF
MPDLSNLLLPPFPDLRPCDPACSSSSSPRPETLDGGDNLDGGAVAALDCSLEGHLELPIAAGGDCSVLKRDRRGSKKAAGGRPLEEHVKEWVEKKMASGLPERVCSLPFLTNAPKMAECRLCTRSIYPGEERRCSVSTCQESFHQSCAKEGARWSNAKPFKCSQHGCFVCKQKAYWRCVRCPIAAHTKCAPWPDGVISLTNQPGLAVCWKHSPDWRLEKEHANPTSVIEEAFERLPLPYINEEFSLGSIVNDVMEKKTGPSPYVHIRRNVYLVKRKRDGVDAGVGCTNCSADSTCKDDCECRGLSVSCSKACHCSDMCTNKPFRKEKKIKVVKTSHCGWGVTALEAIKKGDFVIEYIGEVIDDAMCEQRLWDMKYRGDQNFYMCEIRKDFTIDATFKGNASRFLNHSCDPNCKLEKWQVDGETRVGVFASRSIEVGEALTYDYRFVHFGPMVKCYCGASTCQGYLGSKKITNPVISCWGCKRKRSLMVMVKVLHLRVHIRTFAIWMCSMFVTFFI